MTDSTEDRPKRPTGRPPIRTPEMVDAILERLAHGESLSRICRSPGMPSSAAFRKWAIEDADLCAQYARARETGCHAMADECVEISDDGRNDFMEELAASGDEAAKAARAAGREHVARSRLRVETRMKLLSKWFPHVYGDRLALDGGITIKRQAADMSDDELAALIAAGKTPNTDGAE